ncbi:alkene reductase [Bosea sp. (in: a-proteobacteria)]|uniref:alkene reductase n=1 Tax=Bosea sp. (in: a-proteobacteria) TaxID=1871050 RepID=UPI00260AECF8|nr:alkene reductase [Bosea sp. (in: a-proteobacteria)]MCO5091271.1 alkene reductase [Bosea sp. (in: a-proteobacteria)]
MYEKLLSPAKVGPWELANRVVMPPLTRSRADGEWVPNARAAEYYGQRSSAGLIICEATQISPDATGYPRTPGIWSAGQTAGWKTVVDAIHAGGAKAVIQLWHCGRVSHPDNQPDGRQPMAPSAVKADKQVWSDKAGGLVSVPMPRAMTEEDIRDVIASHRKACENALAAGFDGVELHGANGYLIDQFASSNTNLRSDGWGGTREKRMRFMEEVLRAAISVYPKDCVGIRLAPYGTFNTIDDDDALAKYKAMLAAAEKLGLGYVHIIRPIVSGNMQVGASPLDRAAIEIARELFSGTIIGVGGYDAASAEDDLQAGRIDLVAFGRAFVGNPDLVRRIREGIALAESDPTTWYAAGDAGYIDYPPAG